MTRKKTVVLTISVFLAVLAASFGVYSMLSAVPDPSLQSQTSMAKYVASKDFDKLSRKEKDKYLAEVDKILDGKRLPSDGLSDEEKKRLFENMGSLMRERFNQKIKEYFSLSKEEKEAYLDKMIAEMRKRRESGGNRPPPPPQGNNTGTAANASQQGAQRTGPSADRMRQRLETTAPEERAMHVQFMKDMRARMQQTSK